MLRQPTMAAAVLVDWLMERALGSATPDQILEGVALRLRDEGVQVERAHLSYTTLHPLNRGMGTTWTVEGGANETYAHDMAPAGGGWMTSPIRAVILSGSGRLRRRLTGPGAMLDFPVLAEFAEAGFTDYFIAAVGFESFFSPISPDDIATAQSGMAISFCTTRPLGFTDDELETMASLARPMAVVIKTANQRQIAESLAECYIGRAAGHRVLGGAIRRGDFAAKEAVVWLSDLRNSTAMSRSMERGAFVSTINDFFEATAGAVEAEGGETLTFIGDGALAIFPVETMGEVGARRAALRAAARSGEAMRALNAVRDGDTSLDWGLALHCGLIDYGNIGTVSRHAWSVIGPVVNETARLEGVTKLSGEPLVVSRAFVAALPEAADWRRIGAFELKGVPEPFDVFAPPRARIAREKAA